MPKEQGNRWSLIGRGGHPKHEFDSMEPGTCRQTFKHSMRRFLDVGFTLNLKLIAVEQSLRHSSERIVDREDDQAILQLLCLDWPVQPEENTTSTLERN